MDTDFKTQALGAVLPTTTPTAKLEPGTHTVAIDGFDDSGMIRCVYPDGFVKHHQADTVTELAEKVARQVRGRYGVQDVPFAPFPPRSRRANHSPWRYNEWPSDTQPP